MNRTGDKLTVSSGVETETEEDEDGGTPVQVEAASGEAQVGGWNAVNRWVEAALKWIEERVGYALGALVHQCVAFLLGLVDAMGRYLLGR